METVQLIMLIGMIIILSIAILSAVYACLGYYTMKDPKTYIIEADEQFATKLYENFAKRLTTDPTFIQRAKEAVGMA